MSNTETHNIDKNNLYTVYKKGNSGIENKISNYSSVHGYFYINNFEFNWNRYRNGIKGRTSIKKSEYKNLFSLILNIEEKLIENNTILPIFSYHGTGRLWEHEWKPSSKMENLQRIDAYKDCLNAKSNYRNFLSWFEKLSRMAFDGEPNQLLENVKEVIKETLNYLTEKDIKNITYRDRDLLITYANEEIDKVGLLSDGYRNIIGLVSDIAYRIAILNPSLTENIKNTPGIVLIDEIDLHLHPKWQKDNRPTKAIIS